jgi:hypothetical protein
MKKNLVHAIVVTSFLIIGACTGTDGGQVTQEVATDSVAAELVTPPDGGPIPLVDVVARLDEGLLDTPDWGKPEVPLGCEPGQGCFLDKCTENSQCQSGWCVEHMGEGVCSQSCQDECPAGWSCQHVAGSDPDVVYICVPNYVNLCRPCSTGNDCKSLVGSEDVCLDYGTEGSFCGGQCSDSQECPWGFSCLTTVTVDGISTLQCVADAGVCPCTGKSIALSLWAPCEVSTEWGKCEGKRVCTDTGLAACDALTPAQEECNGVDDDCDGEIDEDSCDDGNACTNDSCQGDEGCTYESLSGLECIDGDICTTADHCEDGECVGSAVICDDKNPCTDDHCTVEGGCENLPNVEKCDDGDPCTVADQCESGKCAGYAVDCDCQSDDDCTEFEDGNLCNGTLSCDLAQFPHKCVVAPGTVVTCPGPVGPEGICLAAVCNPVDGSCDMEPDHEGYACSKGDKCVIGLECQQGTCVGGVSLNCDDGNDCTEDSCLPESGCTHVPSDGACSDGNICTADDICENGTCLPGPPLDCADNNPCTEDTCSSVTGCVHTPTIAPDAFCCSSPSDCPAEFSSEPTCGVTQTCQGNRKTAICQDNQCGSVVEPDDSACQGLADDCGLFADINCSGDIEQLQKACLLSCKSDQDCDSLAYCDGICKSDIPNGNSCVSDNQCESGNCNPAPNGIDWFCNAAIHECAMDDGAGVHDGYSYCYSGDVWSCLEADEWEMNECADDCGYYLPVDDCQGAKCGLCPSFCGSDSDCDANAHCDGECLADLELAMECDEDSDCASDNCGTSPSGADFCISAKDECSLDDGGSVDSGYQLCIAGDHWLCAGDDLWTTADCADDCGLFQGVDTCQDGICQVCATQCADDEECDLDAHCDDVCVEDLPDGESCNEGSDCISGHCGGGFCCSNNDCCQVAGDCPGEYTEAVACSEVSTCQGFRIDAACSDFMCASTLVEDDSACTPDLEANPCGNYLSTFCTGEMDQLEPACPASCDDDGACDDGFHCDEAACIPDVDLGADCDEDSDCAEGLCHSGRCCQEACSTDGCLTGQCGDDGSCTSHTSGHQNCEACHACDGDGQCVPQTAAAADATALGCDAGSQACRSCENGACTFFTQDQHSCPSNHSCNSEGACEANAPQYVDICFGGYPQNKNVSSYCPSGYSHYYHVCGASSISSYDWGPYYDDKYLTGGGHCSCCCNCNSVCVRCKK